MNASQTPEPRRAPRPPGESLSALALAQRMDEEIARAERHGTALSCLLVGIDDIEQLAGEQDPELPAQTLAYVAGALERQLRRFDRVGRPSESELAIVLPGADGRHAELVARRALGRMHAIKIELEGVRRPLHVSVGIAAWQQGVDAQQLLEQARLAAAAGRGNGAVQLGPAGPDGPYSQHQSEPEVSS